MITSSRTQFVPSATARAIADSTGANEEAVTTVSAHVWIPDDAAWAGTQGMAHLAPASIAGTGTVLATSPFLPGHRRRHGSAGKR